MVIDVIHFDDGVCYPRTRVFVTNHTLNSTMNLKQNQVSNKTRTYINKRGILALPDLLHVDQQRLFVVLPLGWKLAGVRKFITRQLHRHFKAVGVKVAEVIHAWK